jgi:hypothetical protein
MEAEKIPISRRRPPNWFLNFPAKLLPDQLYCAALELFRVLSALVDIATSASAGCGLHPPCP